MKVKLIITLLIFCFFISEIHSEEYTLNMLINSLDNNIHFEKAIALSQTGFYDYKAARASLFPSISGNIPFTISDTETNSLPAGSGNQPARQWRLETPIRKVAMRCRLHSWTHFPAGSAGPEYPVPVQPSQLHAQLFPRYRAAASDHANCARERRSSTNGRTPTRVPRARSAA